MVKFFSGRWGLLKLCRRRLKSPGGGWLLQHRLVGFVSRGEGLHSLTSPALVVRSGGFVFGSGIACDV